MKAMFADLSETTRRYRAAGTVRRAHERCRVLALYDAIQVALANQQHDRARLLLQELQGVVGAALARRRRTSPDET